MEKQNIPVLRFPEFEGDWEINLLGETCNVKTGNKDTKDKKQNGKYPFFVRSNVVERIDSFTHDGEAILTSGDGVGVGKNFHYINGKFDYHQRVYALKDFDDKYSAKFIYQVFSEKFYKRVLGLSAKNSVDSVRMDFITKMKMSFPKLSEQQKIASFLSEVDKKLNLLQQKKSLLEDYKKGVMQQIFSQKLRFKDENGNEYPEWEEKKLGEVANCLDNKRKPLNEKERNEIKGRIPYWGANGIVDYVNEFIFDETIVLLAEDGGYFDEFQHRPIANISYGKCWVNNHAHVIQGIEGVLINEFLFYSLVHKNILGYVNGGTRAKLNKSEMLKIKISIPSIKEQTQIANFLSVLDEKIQLVSSQIEQTQQFKKGLLQQMFV